MYGVTSQAGYVHSYVNSDYSNNNWQQTVAYDKAVHAPEAKHSWTAPVEHSTTGSMPFSSDGQVGWTYAEHQANGYQELQYNGTPGQSTYLQAQIAVNPAYQFPQTVPSYFVQNSPPNCVEHALKSAAGRPPHAVVAFGFGGTFAMIKPALEQSFHNQESQIPGLIEMHNLSSIVQPTAGLDFNVLENKSRSEILKWIDERTFNCAYEETDSRNVQTLPLVWGALKVALKHHGKLRSPKTGFHSEVNGNGPEASLGQLILSAARSSAPSNGCLQHLPTEETLQETASTVKALLLSGKSQQALQCAQEGQLWGPALVLAAQLGNKFYSDTVSKMAFHELAPGPLRTLSLLMGGQSAEVFGNNPSSISSGAVESTEESMIQNWHENLAVMATNRTFGDEFVITQLGDSLWNLKGEVAAAHLCYLVVDQNSESFFNDGRICLIGADHWKNPRTFATPIAIKRTELYEYVKTMGNSQFVLATFQPYKIMYASMLAEAGQLAEALSYCQAVLKTLKGVHSNPHLEACRQAATDLENRLLAVLENGKGAYGKLAGRILSNTFSYVISSLPTSKITRYNSSASIKPSDDFSSNITFPPRSASEPDLSKSAAVVAGTKAPSGSFLHRVGSSVFQKAAGLVVKSKQANLGESNKFHFDDNQGVWIEAADEKPVAPNVPSEDQSNSNHQSDKLFNGSDSGLSHGPPPLPRKPNGLYVQCTGYYSRCMSTFNKDGRSQLVKSLTSPQLPPALKLGSRKWFEGSPAMQRVEV